MQTTLLGLAIAFILALVAALVGPFFIDWSQFRPQFEAEATRIVGAPVRVAGALDARLLPAPSLQLHGLTIGSANDLGRLRAERLDVEFSLGSLLRGEWRATELTINGAAADLGLNAQGRLDLPAATGPFNLGALAIDRLNVTGRLNLHDALSRSTIELSDIAFSGDVRSLAAGAMRGDGNFTRNGARYPFRISSGQTGDGNGTRLRLVIDGNAKFPGVDLDGVLSFDNRTPSFDGAATIASAPTDKADVGLASAPWRIVSKVKANPSQAQFEAVDISYGADDGGLKLTGVADLRFGVSPLLHAVLTAKQLDVDRLLAKLDDTGDATPIAALRRLTSVIPQPVLRTQLAVSAEQVMLGGRPVLNIGADLHGDRTSWSIERLEFRAPGATRVVASGAAQSSPAGGFAGAISIDAADPDVLAGWLKGRNDARLRDQKPLRIRGNFMSSTDRLAVDGLKAEIDGGTLEGRIALNYPSSSGGSRIDAELRADRLDLDAATALLRSLSGPQAEWPETGQLSLDIGRAVSAGQEMRPFAARLTYSPKMITLDRFKVGEAAGLLLDGSGAFDREEATGKLTLTATAPSLVQIGKVIESFAPAAAGRLDALPATPGGAKLRLSVDVGRSPTKSDRADVRMSLDIDAPQIKGALAVRATPAVTAIRGFDADALSQNELSLETKLTGQGRVLLALLGLNGVLAAGDAPLVLDASAAGAWRAPMRVKAKLSGPDLDADVQGSAEPSTPKATLAIAVRAANAAPALGLDDADPFARISLSSRVALNGDKLNLDDIDGAIAGARLRGRFAVTLGSEKVVDGQLGADNIDLALALGWMIGARGHDASEPLGGGALQGWRGQLAFEALRAKLPGGAEIQPLKGTIRSDGRALTIDAIKGKLGGGDVVADIDLRPVAATGYAVGARVEVTGAEGSALRYRGLVMPAGKTSLKMSISSQGRSASALEGAVSGDGLVTIDALRIAGLDPRVFDVAINASDTGRATNDARLKEIVEPALTRGAFAATTAQIPFSIKDSRLRVGATTMEAEGTRVVVSGGYDIVADQVDIRASLLGAATGGSTARPEIQLFLMGPPDRLDRAIDIAALSSWLAVRAIDRETRRLDLLERGASQAPAPVPAALPPSPPETPAPIDDPTSSAPTSPDIPLPRRAPPRAAAPRPVIAPPAVPPVVSQQVAPLPAPIEIRPAPGATRVQPKQRPSQPLVLTPPAAVPLARPTF